jgi:flavin reductase (DIM6/NTAB) family NADH-FMN oxidoreductase RutF
VAWLDCRVHARLPAGDHEIVLGSVLEGSGRGGGARGPGVYRAGAFWRLAAAES